ncbi:FAD-dependent oxidoreductase [Fluviispira multicolorata]|uniref:Pyridine nucleotide-disulfide oxidoreductase n=1 Tax=Fluviispira multicolorata TaxID=2654512 RepID=A0A833JFD0_9BACT|nr:bifunctional TVP38/TMEM64 family protein/FAD-dependent oxidoreductase [Fluviispira multicolorata]KAB8030970.1 pyridine nucleotide-disulfide oxidoreductase [Fluviispira multicolorata]
MKINLKKVIIVIVFFVIIFLFKYFDLNIYFNLDYIKENKEYIQKLFLERKIEFISIYFFIYVILTAVSFPGAAVLTLLGGALFGISWGTALISLASTIGATIAFLSSRYILRDALKNKFSSQIEIFQNNFQKNGKSYLFTLRAIPIFPFFMVNFIMGFTTIRVRDYFWVSMLGMLPGTIIYVNAGKQISEINNARDIFSLELLISFALLGFFPYLIKRVISYVTMKYKLSKFKKPKKFDYNIIVIGGGAAGLVTSYISSTVKAKVALIEKNKMGGDCLYTGCVPSKAIIKSSKVISYLKNSHAFGIENCKYDINFQEVMIRVKRVISKIEPHDSPERYSILGVECIFGEAKIISPYEVQVNNKTLTTRNIVISTGASPYIFPFPGLEKIDFRTSENIWDLESLPKNFLIIGGGAIGCEMAQAFSRLGSSVTIVEKQERIFFKEDHDVSFFIENIFINENIKILTSKNILNFDNINGNNFIKYEDNFSREQFSLEFDIAFIALGRKANVHGFGIEELGIQLNNNGTIECDEFLRTNYHNIFVCGDVAGPYQFTHMAAHQAWYAAVISLFGDFKRFKVNYKNIPWTTFIDPEISRLGLNEIIAKQEQIPFEIVKYDLSKLDRALIEGEAKGFVKILVKPNTDKILGVTIIGAHAGELMAEFTLAMKYNLGLNKILSTIHAYPTFAEANKFVAGEWKKAHAPKKILAYLQKYHAWKRG